MPRVNRTATLLMVAIAVIGLPAAAAADLVYGTMLIGKTPKPKVTFHVVSGTTTINVVTDANGKFRATLKPGRYTATYTEGDKTYKGVLHAEEYPVKENVTFAL